MNIIDMHCDTILRLYEGGEELGLRSNSLHLDLEKMRRGGLSAQFFALFVKLESHPDPLRIFLAMADRFRREIRKNADLIAFAENLGDLERNSAKGLMSAFLTIEDGGALLGDDTLLRTAYELGVRLITLTWNYENALGFPNSIPEHRETGLKTRGRETVELMNELGMIVDVSHLSDGGFRDVAAISRKPFIASHSNSRSVCDHPRNLTDGMIRTLADAGGIIGLNFCPAFLCGGNTAKIASMIEHLKHIKKVGGSEVLAMGSDFDGIGGDLEVGNAGEFPLLLTAMEKAGFTKREIELAARENALRLIGDVL